MGEEKKKKKQTKYYDDGRTIADMSSLYGRKSADNSANKDSDEPDYHGNPGLFSPYRPGHGPKDWLKTYWNTVKTMFLPMLVTIGIISVAFLVLWILLELAS